MNLSILVYIASALSVFTLGTIVGSRVFEAGRSYFALICVAVSLWLGSQLMSILFPASVDMYIIITLSSFSFAIYGFSMLALEVMKLKNQHIFRKVFFASLVLSTTLSLYPGTLISASAGEWGVVIEGGWLYVVQTCLDAATASLVILFIWRAADKKPPEEKVVLRYFMYGAGLFFAANICAGLLFANNYEAQILVPLSVVVLVYLTGLGTVKHYQIEKFNAEVSRLTTSLQTENSELARINQEKDEFISVTSHQLRTPLTVLNSYISLLESEKLGDVNKKQRSALHRSKQSISKMIHSVNDLLTVVKLEGDTFTLEVASSDLVTVLKDAVSDIQPLAESKNIQIITKSPKRLELPMDSKQIEVVLDNLLSNAIHYSPNGSVVTVKLQSKNGVVTLTVTDQGIGVKKSEQKIIFSKFQRSAKASLARPGGTGLGLFFVQKIVELHGGEIILTSKPGAGSTFGFRLPIKPSLKQ